MKRQLINYMEVCVRDLIPSVTKDILVCKCEKCIMDTTALVLNSLPTKYVVTRKGELFIKLEGLEQQFDVNIISEIAKAAKMVNENPQHDDENN